MADKSIEENDGRHDFDFFVGKWKIHNRRLKERLKGCTEWEEFEGECDDRTTLNGLGNVDTGIFYRNGGVLHGMTVRLFEPKSQEWRLYWADSVAAQRLELPMVGKFKDGVGEFYCHEPFEGRMVYTRFIWSGITATTCHWEQAFSEDGGRTWETNWTMDSERME